MKINFERQEVEAILVDYVKATLNATNKKVTPGELDFGGRFSILVSDFPSDNERAQGELPS